jgi:hypothetical protein
MSDPIASQPVAITADSARRRLGDLAEYVAVMGDIDAAEIYREACVAAERKFERKLQTRLGVTRILAGDNPGLVQSDPANDIVGDYDVLEDFSDYRRGEMATDVLPRKHAFSRPIISVQSVSLEFGPTAQIITFPMDWIQIYHQIGQFAITPVGTSPQIAAAMGMWYAGLLDKAWTWDVIPGLWHWQYTAGYPNPATNPELDEMRIELSFAAAANVIESVRHMIPDSVAVGGAGYNSTRTPLSQTLDTWNKRTDAFLASWNKQHRSVKFVMV